MIMLPNPEAQQRSTEYLPGISAKRRNRLLLLLLFQLLLPFLPWTVSLRH
jgi:hypothetical protein